MQTSGKCAGFRQCGRGLHEKFRQITVRAAIESGDASPDADVDALFEFLRGATVVRALTRGDEDADDFCRQIAEALAALATTARG